LTRRVLILGAGVYQVPLIQKAKAIGCHVIVATCRGDYPGLAQADETWFVDTRNHEELCRLCKASGVEAVLTTGTDVAIPSMGYICDQLGLPGITYETSQLCSNKILAQQRFAEHGVPAAMHKCVGDLDEAIDAVRTIGLPVIIKAPDSSGSRGVITVNYESELASAFEQAMAVSQQDKVLVEELLIGDEFGAQAIVSGGRVLHCLCHNDTVTPPPISVPIGHSCPFNMADEIQRQALDVTQQAVSALGIDNAVCNVDLLATEHGVHILEIGARIGATGIPEIVRRHFGIDLYALALQMAFGQSPQVEIQPGPASATLIIRSHKTGMLTRCRIPDHFKEHPEIDSIHFDYPEGAEVNAFLVGPDRIGDIFVTGSTAHEAETFAAKVASELEIDVAETADSTAQV
jgi:biotin carboxylase